MIKTSLKQYKVFRKGDYCLSKYRARWIGVILEIVKRKDMSDLCIVLIVRNSKGGIPNNMMLATIDTDWLVENNVVDCSMINKEWFNQDLVKFVKKESNLDLEYVDKEWWIV
jgi:hypothetical protein